jgi:hypothetical protein
MNRVFTRFPWLADVRLWLLVYSGVAIIATLYRLWLGHSGNNFSIFRWSFYNLAHENNLYAYHLEQHRDLFKYSPTFAFLMAPFYALPRWAGLVLWNFLNTLLPVWAISSLNISRRAKAFCLLFIALELLISIENAQSNGIAAALMIGAFAAFERRQPVLTAFLVCLGFYVKVFAVAIGILFVFYDRKVRFLLATGVWMLVLGCLPLFVTSFGNLISSYKDWLHLLATDPTRKGNFSVMTLSQTWFNFTAADIWYLVPALCLLLLPLLRTSQWGSFSYRLLYLASILIWVVIFNHKAESPTYVIAVAGVALWALVEPNTYVRVSMLWFVFLFTSLASTDLFSRPVRQQLWQALHIKALPCVIVWGLVTWRLLRLDEWKRPDIDQA